MSVPGPPNITQQPFASPGTLEFEWQPPTVTNGTITGYRLMVGATEILLDGTAGYYMATGLSNGTTYSCTLEAQNANGYGPAASFLDFQPGSPPAAAPASVSVVANGVSTATVSWTPPASLPDALIQWYAIYANGPTSTFSYTANAATQSSYLLNNLVGSVYDYTFDVYPVNCPGWGPVRTGSPNLPGRAIWATTVGGLSSNEARPWIRTDSAGNIYMVGFFGSATFYINNYNTAPVGGGAVGMTQYGTMTNSGSSDIFLVKYNSSGAAQWATKIAGTGAEDEPYVAIDSDGNVYVTGFYSSSSITISSYSSAPVSGGAVGLSTYGTLPNAGSNDVFLVKYNSSGVAQWATKIGGTGSDPYPFVQTDSTGNVYLAALIGSTTTTINNYSSAPSGGGAVGLTAYGTLTGSSNTVCLIKYNSSGTAQWATSILGAGADRDIGIATDSNNNVYFSGRYPATTCTISSYNSAPVAGGAVGLSTYGTLTTIGGYDIFLVKYNSSGVAQWATNIGSTGLEEESKVATDSAGNVIIAGAYTNNPVTISNFNSAPVGGGAVGLVTYGTIPNGNPGATDIFVVKYNSSGVAQWATRIGGVSNDVSEYEPDIAIDSNNNIYIVGVTNGNNTQFYNYSSAPSGGGAVGLTTYARMPVSGAFLTKYNSSGSCQWATRMLSARQNSVAVDTNANVYIVGNFFVTSSVLYNYSTVSASVMVTTQYGTLNNPGTTNTYEIYLARYGS